MVDCSHANSGKLHGRQVEVARDVAAQIEGGDRCIFGVMVESHLQAGAQKFVAGKDDPARLVYGQSITDACLGWDDSVQMLERLSASVACRRAKEPATSVVASV
jgi:3-deoxy-7-phosphoheptulonate synthase